MISLHRKQKASSSSLRQKAENGGFLSKRQKRTMNPDLLDSVKVAKETGRKTIEDVAKNESLDTVAALKVKAVMNSARSINLND